MSPSGPSAIPSTASRKPIVHHHRDEAKAAEADPPAFFLQKLEISTLKFKVGIKIGYLSLSIYIYILPSDLLSCSIHSFLFCLFGPLIFFFFIFFFFLFFFFLFFFFFFFFFFFLFFFIFFFSMPSPVCSLSLAIV
tara:strand:+ start:489 stop:896 length:408 start_codon:yes stop_codon:yes gene_type:complete